MRRVALLSLVVLFAGCKKPQGGGADAGLGLDAGEVTVLSDGGLLAAVGDQVQVDLRLASEATPVPSMDSLRPAVNYFRHSQHAVSTYVGHMHRATRVIDVNWALQNAQCVDPTQCAQVGKPADKSYLSLLTDNGAKTGTLFKEAAQSSDDIIVFFDRMPEWLSSCSSKTTNCTADTGCGYRSGTYKYQLYPPNDWTAWSAIVRDTVDVLLDLTEVNGQPRTIYLEARNEPNVASCSWADTSANLLDYYGRTAKAFAQARDSLCASKGFSASRCARLKIGGVAVSYWSAKIDSTDTEPFTEELIAYALQHKVPLDFVSFHGFWGSAPTPSEDIAAAKAAFTQAYQRNAGANPAFPMPQILISEWNADDADRAGPRHPAIMAEGYLGLAENDIHDATIASLDEQDEHATLDSNDFGLVLPDSVQTNWRRPAYWVYASMQGLTEESSSMSYATNGYAKVMLSAPTSNAGMTCYDAMLWDFSPEPLTGAVAQLADPSQCGTTALKASYAGAVPQGPLPALCAAHLPARAGSGLQALCQDIADGTCANIPSPVPAGGHACDATWKGYFSSAGSLFALLDHREKTPATVVFNGIAGAPAQGLVNIADIAEDHQHPAPHPISPTFSPDGGWLAFRLPRNAVVVAKRVCVK